MRTTCAGLEKTSMAAHLVRTPGNNLFGKAWRNMSLETRQIATRIALRQSELAGASTPCKFPGASVRRLLHLAWSAIGAAGCTSDVSLELDVDFEFQSLILVVRDGADLAASAFDQGALPTLE